MLSNLRAAAHRIAGFLTRGKVEKDFRQEIEEHIALLTEENMQRGMDPQEARYSALRSFGGVTQVAASHREHSGLPLLESLGQDVRFALRLMRRSPGFALVAIVTLALGIGANTAIFSVFNAVLLRPLPYSRPGELISMAGRQSWPDLHDIQQQSRSLESLGAFAGWRFDLLSQGEPEQAKAALVSLDLFDTLGVAPELGRTISSADDVLGGPRVVVTSYGFWQAKLGGRKDAIGKTLSLSGNPYTVVGVMPQNFRLPEGKAELFIPFRVGYPEGASARGLHFQYTVARLRPEWKQATAQAELDGIAKTLAKLYPDENRDRRYVIVPLHRRVSGPVREAILVLAAAVGLLLLIACFNFANLLLAKASSRGEEAKMRAALGATPGRLVRQFLTESLVLSSFGGLAGLALGAWGTRLLLLLKPPDMPSLVTVKVDLPVLLFTLALALLTGVVFGLFPVFQAVLPSRGTPGRAGKERAGESRGMLRVRRVLLAAELAISLVLLSTAGLLFRTLWQLQRTDPGFDVQGVLSAYIQLPPNRYATIERQNEFFAQLEQQLQRLPGISSATLGSELPMSGNHIPHNFLIEGRPAPPVGTEPEAQTNLVSPAYFSTLRIPLLAGRVFTQEDRIGSPLVAVVNAAMVRTYFKGQSPLGAQVRFARDPGPPKWMTIVGVVGDVKEFGLDMDEGGAIYMPILQKQEPWRRWSGILLRGADPLSPPNGQLIKQAVWSVDAAVPVTEIQPLSDSLSESLSPRRFNAMLLGAFALTALLLTIAGVYGVISYMVTLRTREIGVRIALGASRLDVLKLLLKQGAAPTLAGVLLGLGGTLLAGRITSRLLFNMGSSDPLTLLSAAGLLAAMAMCATFIPSQRATRVDPVVALRCE
jgi:putative ABC transport system permease protein